MGSTNYFVTGIKENALESSSVFLYPNPSQDILNIDIRNDLTLSGCKIYNQLGQLVLKSENRKELSIAELNPGLYELEVSTDKGSVRKKIVKE
jgi:hypothetical protein